MKYALLFIVLGFACAYLAFTYDNLFIRIITASSAIAFFGVGLGYAGLGPGVFLKRPDGRLNLISYILFWPYHLLNVFGMLGFHRAGKENTFDRIDENVYLGCHLGRCNDEKFAKLGIVSVLDLTCEFGEVPALRQLSYYCIPLLDTHAPTVEQLKAGTDWIQKEAARGPVYVHCALGHGRSATFVAAFLLHSGKARTAQEAVDRVAALRPKIGLSASQMAALKQLESATKTR